MKYSLGFVLITLFMLSACGKKHDGTSHAADDANEDNDPNTALYNEVQDIHMDAMTMMDDVLKLKTELREKLEKGPTMAPDKKARLGAAISTLDSANNAMLSWMHEWMRSPPDSSQVEKRREYFETQMEAIKGIRITTAEAIERARDLTTEN